MNVLVACEESQRVCIAFRERGHNAFSCDLMSCSGGHPEWHILGNVLAVLEPNIAGWTEFYTMDNLYHGFEGTWDLIIAHPPCTRLCNSGQRWLHYGSEEYRKKKRLEQLDAVSFFGRFISVSCPKVAIENPVGIMSSLYREPDQIYNPYNFEGEHEQKKTCLWLKGLPKLKHTQEKPDYITTEIWHANFNGKQYGYNDPIVAKLRSKTPWGVARAMAEQWG